MLGPRVVCELCVFESAVEETLSWATERKEQTRDCPFSRSGTVLRKPPVPAGSRVTFFSGPKKVTERKDLSPRGGRVLREAAWLLSLLQPLNSKPWSPLHGRGLALAPRLVRGLCIFKAIVVDILP